MFYDTLFDYADTKVVFKEGERLEREKTIRNWYLQVVSGEFNERFWHEQWQIDQAHVQRDILNSNMLGMMHRIQQFFRKYSDPL